MTGRDRGTVVLTGGVFRTMSTPQTVEALLIRDGRIMHAGTREDCRELGRRIDAQEVSVEGACVLPGFIDPHAHPLSYGQTATMVDLAASQVGSIAELIDRLAARAAQEPPGTPVRGFGYNHRLLAEQRHPTAADLDRVSTDHPVYLMHSSGHHGVANSLQLAQAGIHADSPDPPGGRIVRDAAGHPSGVLLDAATRLVSGGTVATGNHGPNIHIAEPLDQLVQEVDIASRRYSAAGLTTVVDAQVTGRETRAYLTARRRGLLRFRLVLMYLSSHLDQLLDLAMLPEIGDEWMAIGPLKLYVDGALTGGTAYLTGDTSESVTPVLYHEPAEYRTLLTRAAEAGWATGTHAQGDAAIDIVLDTAEELKHRLGADAPPIRIEHCGFPRPEQVARIRDLGCAPVLQPIYIRQYGSVFDQLYGTERAQQLSPMADFSRAGIPLVFSSDSPVGDYRPLQGVTAAVTRLTNVGTTLGAEHTTSTHAALQAYTTNAAAMLNRADKVGTLEAGKLADLVFLEDDPLAVAAEDIADIEVVKTVVGGIATHGEDLP